MPRHDVDDAADRVGAVERGSLRPAYDLDPFDGAGIEAREQQRIRDLDTIDVHLGIAELERARAANAPEGAHQRRRRLRPAPHAWHVAVERVGDRGAVLTRQPAAVDRVQADGELALRRAVLAAA